MRDNMTGFESDSVIQARNGATRLSVVFIKKAAEENFTVFALHQLIYSPPYLAQTGPGIEITIPRTIRIEPRQMIGRLAVDLRETASHPNALVPLHHDRSHRVIELRVKGAIEPAPS